MFDPDMRDKGYDDDHTSFKRMSKEQQEARVWWIRSAVTDSKRGGCTSYYLKHQFEREGFYVTDGEFRGAMWKAGYTPVDPQAENWFFKVKPAWKVEYRGEDLHEGFFGKQYYTIAQFDRHYAELFQKAVNH